MVNLPDDILHLIAEEFFRRRDFSTLLNCAISCRSMAAICVPFMYRMQDVAPAKKDDIDTFTAQGSQKFIKWTRLWQSICSSAVAPETTLMPYVNYVRTLDLGDLRNLFDDFSRDTRKKAKDSFFKGELKKYAYTTQGWGNRKVLHGSKIVIALADEIAKHALFVEELIGDIPPDALERWITTMPRLVSLRIWSGKAIIAGKAAQNLKEHCPLFTSLCIHNFHELGDSADDSFADFILGLREQSLSRVDIMSCKFLKNKTLQSLAISQARSLRALLLDTVDIDLFVSIGKLEEFPALKSITIHGESIDPVAITPEVRSTVSTWLGASPELEELDIKGISPVGNLLRGYLSDFGAECKLRKLDVSSYALADNAKEFHESLSVLSNTVEELKLIGQLREMDDNPNVMAAMANSLASSVSTMAKLKSLSIYGSAWYFTDEMVIRLLCNLTQLEVYETEGSNLSSSTLKCVAGLRNMRTLFLQGNNEFSVVDLKQFLNTVEIGPQGYSVDIVGAHKGITDIDIAIMKSAFAARGGTFEYTPWELDDSDDDADGVYV